ncbi:hypothetical protein KUTeg_001856 [Tegillarca granosa]|uniref:Thioredoxin domain-containing protein n=1 Tax=Tegillarca granosa TaxID=220873 RepID=A0ABQ9FSM3_TEGGR|nr:hypothetical protein KUTeg_001856 [Tegillarca granosa]
MIYLTCVYNIDIILNTGVIDVYQEWCGPCNGMAGNFRKIKNDIGDDLLKFAVVSKISTVE